MSVLDVNSVEWVLAVPVYCEALTGNAIGQQPVIHGVVVVTLIFQYSPREKTHLVAIRPEPIMFMNFMFTSYFLFDAREIRD